MGWTGIKTRDSLMEVFKSEYGSMMFPGSEHEFIKSVPVTVPQRLYDEDMIEEMEIYSAVRTKGIVYAHTLMIKRTKEGEVLYKGQDETVGPYMLSKCPKEIMDLLSPIEKLQGVLGNCEYAKKWRAKQ